MARLTPAEHPGFPQTYTATNLAKQAASLQRLQQRSDKLAKGKVVGALLDWSVADGKALYLVVKEKPLTLQHIPYGDGYRVAPETIRGLRRQDVLHQLQMRKAFRAALQQGRKRGINMVFSTQRDPASSLAASGGDLSKYPMFRPGLPTKVVEVPPPWMMKETTPEQIEKALKDRKPGDPPFTIVNHDPKAIEKHKAEHADGQPPMPGTTFRMLTADELSRTQAVDVEIDYTNHAGKRSKRVIRPLRLRFGTTPKQDTPRWLIDAVDIGRNLERSFSVHDIHSWRELP
jgi:hypothetical protein